MFNVKKYRRFIFHLRTGWLLQLVLPSPNPYCTTFHLKVGKRAYI